MIQLSSFHTFGFGGSRSGSPACLAACTQFAAQVPAGAQVVTTCGRGAPAVIRAAFPAAQVHTAAQFTGIGRAAFAARAAAMVRSIAGSPSPLFVCFPGCPCPASLRPGRSWQSSGSGSWSECAMCAGLGVPVLVFLPAAIQPPPGWGSWQPAGTGWFLLSPSAPTLF